MHARTHTLILQCIPGHGTGEAGGVASPCVTTRFTSSMNVFKGSEVKDERGREKGKVHLISPRGRVEASRHRRVSVRGRG